MFGLPILAQAPLFAGLSGRELEALSASLRRRRYTRGEVVFHQDDPGATCYIVERGRVRIARASPDGKEITLAIMGPGDLFGELALLDGEPRSADAVAVEPCQLLQLQREDFLDFLRSHYDASLRLLAALSRRLRHTNDLLQDAVFLDVPGRLAKVLLELAESQGQTTEEGIVIAPRLTQGELAALVGTSRETINRWLGYYQQERLVSYEGGRIMVRKPQDLRRRVY